MKNISRFSPEFDYIVAEFYKITENLRIPMTFEEKSKFESCMIKNIINLQNFTSTFFYCLRSTTVDPLRNIFYQHELQYGELTTAERDFLSSTYLFKPTDMLVIPDKYVTYFVRNALIANHSSDEIARTAAENRLIGLLKDYGTYENLKNKLMQNIRRLSKKDRQALLYFHNNRDKTYAYNSTSQLEPFVLALTGLEELRFNIVVLMELSHEVFDEINLAEYINTCTDETQSILKNQGNTYAKANFVFNNKSEEDANNSGSNSPKTLPLKARITLLVVAVSSIVLALIGYESPFWICFSAMTIFFGIFLIKEAINDHKTYKESIIKLIWNILFGSVLIYVGILFIIDML